MHFCDETHLELQSMDGALPAQGTTAATKAMLSLHLTNRLRLTHIPKGALSQTNFAYEMADNEPAEC